MSSLSHILLYLLLFFIFYKITTKKQKYINRHFWHIAFIPILFFTLIIGLRYGWGPDYLWYKFRFEYPFVYADEDIGFRSFNLLLSYLGFNYVGAYLSYSLFFVVSGFVLLRSYYENKYMLFLFLLTTLFFHTTAIRQAFAHSFVFLYIYFLNKRQWKLLIPCLLVQVSIHGASILTSFYVTFFYFLLEKPFNVDKPFNYKYSLVLYISLSLMSVTLSSYISMIVTEGLGMIGGLDNKFQGYIENSDRWFGEEAIDEERIQSTFGFLTSLIYYSSSIYIGYIALKYKPKKNVLYMYNASVVSFILFRLFLLFEILKRMVIPLEMLCFIPTGYALYFYKNCRSLLTKKERKYCTLSVIAIVVYYILFFGRFIFLSPGRLFVWD